MQQILEELESQITKICTCCLFSLFTPENTVRTNEIEFRNLKAKRLTLTTYTTKVLHKCKLWGERETSNFRMNIQGTRCADQILHNPLQTSADIIPIVVEATVNKTLQYFDIFTVQVEELQEFWWLRWYLIHIDSLTCKNQAAPPSTCSN
jgi:hypothetical protein